MGDNSDEEMDFKRRDKFRSERRYDDDGPPPRRDWGGRDGGGGRHGGHGGPPSTYGAYRRNHRRDSYSPDPGQGRGGRHEMSPPPKRARGNWDDDNGPPRQYRRQQNQHEARQEDGFQPAMMSFKAFLSNQDDTITDEESIKKYAEYKLEFKRQQLNEFFVTHKAEEWFKQKYHPDDSVKRREEMTDALKRRVEVFQEFFDKGRIKEVAVDTEKQEKLVRLLDMVVIRLEGGVEEDFAVLDMPDGEEVKKKVEEEVVEKGEEVKKVEEEEKGEGVEKGDEGVEKGEKENSDGEKAAKVTEVGLENLKDDLDLSDLSDKEDIPDAPDQEESKDDNAKEVNGEAGEVTDTSEKVEEEGAEVNKESNTTEEKVKEDESDEKIKDEKMEEGSEAPPNPDESKPRVLHKTTSIYLRNLAPTITKQEVVAICKRFDGFLRCAISDPSPTNRWFRRGWITFNRNAKIKEICFNLNSIRLRDCEVGPAVNRDLARRIRPVVGLAIDKRIVRNDIKLAVKIIANLDSRWGLWVKDGGSAASQDMFGLTSNNPLLANVTDYLIEEANAEEEELLGKSGEDGEVGDEGETVVRDEELIRVLDNLILYLRIVHSIDFYNHSEYPYEDEMPNRCGMIHARGTPPEGPVQQGEIQTYITDFEKKIGGFMAPKQDLGDEDIMKLGAKNEEDEVQKFVAVNTQELGKDKWLCPLSGKKFKGPEFIRKHIENKHGQELDEVKKEVQYFNNFLKDPKRPQLPENPKAGGGRGSGARPDNRGVGGHRRGDPYSYSGAPRDATNYPVYRDRERQDRPYHDRGPPGRGVRDRLGYGGVRVTHNSADPRAIIDYSDVDNVGNGDYF